MASTNGVEAQSDVRTLPLALKDIMLIALQLIYLLAMASDVARSETVGGTPQKTKQLA